MQAERQTKEKRAYDEEKNHERRRTQQAEAVA
jgi:hypothetical protein